MIQRINDMWEVNDWDGGDPTAGTPHGATTGGRWDIIVKVDADGDLDINFKSESDSDDDATVYVPVNVVERLVQLRRAFEARAFAEGLATGETP